MKEIGRDLFNRQLFGFGPENDYYLTEMLPHPIRKDHPLWINWDNPSTRDNNKTDDMALLLYEVISQEED